MRKKLFLIINSLHGGGAEHVACRLTNELMKNYEIFIFSLTCFTDDDYNFMSQCISLNDYYIGKSTFFKIRNCAKKIDEFAMIHKPVAIIGFLQNANLCVSMTTHNTIKILSIRNCLSRQYSGIKQLIWNYLIKKYFKRCDYIISVSKEINKEMITTYNIPEKKCRYIYNPYNSYDIEILAKEMLSVEEMDFFRNHIVISNMGHLSKQKGQYHLLRVMPELKKRYKNLRLVVIGNYDGVYGRKIKEMIHHLSLEDSILLTGIQKNPYKYISRSKIFVFTSLYEGFPNALVEAMICGVPVISSRCKSGPEEILMDLDLTKYGVLIDDDQTEWLDADEPLIDMEYELINSIDKLLSNQELYNDLMRKAKQRSRFFSFETIIPQWEELFKNEVD